MENFFEKRYPFDDASEFFSGQYWIQIEAWHLTSAWIFLVFYICYIILLKKGMTFVEKLSCLYFSTYIYNNPAFNIYSLPMPELIGSAAAAFYFIFYRRTDIGEEPNSVYKLLIFSFYAIVLFNVFIAIIYPNLNPDDDTLYKRVFVTFRIAILSINLLIIGRFCTNKINLDFICGVICLLGAFSCILYIWQLTLNYIGIPPYGTFTDAGFAGLPSFGSVSIERGHYGKLMAPLFPFFIYSIIRFRNYYSVFAVSFYFLVMSINLSASSLVFFTISCVFSIVIFWKNISKMFVFLTSYLVLGVAVFLYGIFYEAINGIIEKIYLLAIEGDEMGGRSISVFLDYREIYPWGIGYGGSTLRTIPGLREINSGLFAFISQLSYLGYFAIILFLIFTARTIAIRTNLRDRDNSLKSMKIGVMVAPFIFFSDILWFTPTVWLSYQILFSQKNRMMNDAEARFS